jgi:hypothetical protein
MYDMCGHFVRTDNTIQTFFFNQIGEWSQISDYFSEECLVTVQLLKFLLFELNGAFETNA